MSRLGRHNVPEFLFDLTDDQVKGPGTYALSDLIDNTMFSAEDHGVDLTFVSTPNATVESFVRLTDGRAGAFGIPVPAPTSAGLSGVPVNFSAVRLEDSGEDGRVLPDLTLEVPANGEVYVLFARVVA